MGIAKRHMEEMEDKRNLAIRIAVEAGVLDECEYHDGTFTEGSNDIEEAYKLGNSRISSGELDGAFDSRREMTDLIKAVVDELSADECYSCARHRDE